MSKKHDPKIDAFVGLSEALRIVMQKNPWMPPSALREAVRLGRVPSRRSSDKKRARYYVRVADLEKAVI